MGRGMKYKLLVYLVLVLGISRAVCTTVSLDASNDYKFQVSAVVSRPGYVVGEADNDILDFQLRLYKPGNSNIAVYDDGFDDNDVYDMERGYFSGPGVWRVWVVGTRGRGSVKLCSDVVTYFNQVTVKKQGFISKILSWLRSIFGI